MAKNFGQKFLALQLGMLFLGVVLFLGGYALKKSLQKEPPASAAQAENIAPQQ